MPSSRSERAARQFSILDRRPQIADRYEQQNGEPLAHQPVDHVLNHVYGVRSLKNTKWLFPAGWAMASLLGSGWTAPRITNFIYNYLNTNILPPELAMDLVPLSQMVDYRNFAVIAILGVAWAGAVSAFVPVKKPVTVAWKYSSPGERAWDYAKMAAISGPVVGVNQQNKKNFSKPVAASLNFTNDFILIFQFLPLHGDDSGDSHDSFPKS